MGDKKELTTNAGCPVAHNQNVMTAGPRGSPDKMLQGRLFSYGDA